MRSLYTLWALRKQQLQVGCPHAAKAGNSHAVFYFYKKYFTKKCSGCQSMQPDITANPASAAAFNCLLMRTLYFRFPEMTPGAAARARLAGRPVFITPPTRGKPPLTHDEKKGNLQAIISTAHFLS